MSRSKILIFIGIILGAMILLGILWGVLGKTKQTDQVQDSPPPLSTGLWTPTRPAHCVPIPRNPTPAGPPTATPDRFHTGEPVVFRTVTPRPYAHIYDLSPELPIEEKAVMIVFRCNGTFDKYWGGPEINFDEYLRMEPGDVLLNTIAPAILMGHQPPEPPSLTITP